MDHDAVFSRILYMDMDMDIYGYGFYIWIMMKYFPGFYNYTGGASVWEEAEARSNFFV